MPWQNKPLLPPLPPELLSIVSAFSTVGTTVGAVLQIAADLLEAAKLFYLAATDPYKPLVAAIIVEIEDLINDLFTTGVYQLIVDPFSIVTPGQKKDRWGIPLLTPGQAINAAIKSFDDLGDINRPIFSPSSQVASLAVMITTPSFGELITLIESLISVLNIDDLRFLKIKLEREKNGRLPRSRPPDWSSVRLNQIETMAEIQTVMLDNLSLVKGYIVVADAIILDLIDVISKKLADIQEAVDILNQLILNIQNIADMNQAYIMDLPLTVGGVELLKKELSDPALMANKVNQYTFMWMLVGGGPSASTAEILRGLMT